MQQEIKPEKIATKLDQALLHVHAQKHTRTHLNRSRESVVPRLHLDELVPFDAPLQVLDNVVRAVVGYLSRATNNEFTRDSMPRVLHNKHRAA